jgi:hypothetical protein
MSLPLPSFNNTNNIVNSMQHQNNMNDDASNDNLEE